jgi:hypothetical protein
MAPVLTSIAEYYHRATTTSRPMSRLIALVMVILLGALGFQFSSGPTQAGSWRPRRLWLVSRFSWR